MNPFQAIMGCSGPVQVPAGPTAQMNPGGPFGAMQALIQRAQHMANSFRNPQQMVQQYFPDAPAEIAGDPEQLVGWLQQTGRVTPQMVQMARQMMGR